jgi:hypothetical protein
MNLKNIEKAKKILPILTPEVIVELLASQMGIAEEARDRIIEEGIVVRDMKGSVIEHPAIKIEQSALKIINDLLKNKKNRHG